MRTEDEDVDGHLRGQRRPAAVLGPHKELQQLVLAADGAAAERQLARRRVHLQQLGCVKDNRKFGFSFPVHGRRGSLGSQFRDSTIIDRRTNVGLSSLEFQTCSIRLCWSTLRFIWQRVPE